MATDPKSPARPNGSTAATTFFVVVLIASLLALFYLFLGFIRDFALAFVFTSLFRPAYLRLLPRLRGSRTLTAGIVTALVAVSVAVPVLFLVGSLSAEIASFYEHTISRITPEHINQTLFGQGWLATKARDAAALAGLDWNPESVRATLIGISSAVAGFLSGQINLLLSNLLSATFHYVIMLVIVFYMLADGDRLLRFFYDTSPLPQEEEALLVRTFGQVARAALVGNGIGSAIQGILGGLSMAVVGLSSPILWGTVMTVFAFLPLVGVSLVTIPAALVLAFSEQYVAAVLFLAFNTLQALFVENVVKTRLIGSHMSMHNLLIFLSIIGGIATFGVLGILYGPLIVALFLTLTELYHQRYKRLIFGPQPSNESPLAS